MQAISLTSNVRGSSRKSVFWRILHAIHKIFHFLFVAVPGFIKLLRRQREQQHVVFAQRQGFIIFSVRADFDFVLKFRLTGGSFAQIFFLYTGQSCAGAPISNQAE